MLNSLEKVGFSQHHAQHWEFNFLFVKLSSGWAYYIYTSVCVSMFLCHLATDF